jgi:hypothetical protein
VTNVGFERYTDATTRRGAPVYDDAAAHWPINQFVIRVAHMANSVGNQVGSAWITVGGLLAVAGVVGALGFAVKSSVDISQLATQQTYIQRDIGDLKSDVRELRRGLDDRGQRSLPN